MRDYRIEMAWHPDEECNVFWVLEGDVKVEWFYMEKSADLFIQSLRMVDEEENNA